MRQEGFQVATRKLLRTVNKGQVFFLTHRQNFSDKLRGTQLGTPWNKTWCASGMNFKPTLFNFCSLLVVSSGSMTRTSFSLTRPSLSLWHVMTRRQTTTWDIVSSGACHTPQVGTTQFYTCGCLCVYVDEWWEKLDFNHAKDFVLHFMYENCFPNKVCLMDKSCVSILCDVALSQIR